MKEKTVVDAQCVAHTLNQIQVMKCTHPQNALGVVFVFTLSPEMKRNGEEEKTSTI